MVRNITKTLCTLAPMMERSFDMFCLSTKNFTEQMCLYLLLCIEPRNCQVNFARKKRTWKSHTCQCSQTEGAFHKLHWYELIWQVLDSPFFSNVGHYAVYCNGNWSPTLIQGGGTPTLFGIHFACIETMKHETYSSSPSMHWNWTTTDVSQSVGQFKTEAAVQG